MNKKIIIFLVLPAIALAPFAFAATDYNAQQVVPDVPGVTTDIFVAAGPILSFLWEAFAIFAVIMLVIAGFFFLTSRGDPEAVKTARNMVLWAVVGIVIAILAFSIPKLISSTVAPSSSITLT